MRLLFISNFYPPYDTGGLEQLCQDVTLHLKDRGHQVVILTSRFGVNHHFYQEEGVIRSLYLQADNYYYKPIDFFLKTSRQERENQNELIRVLDDYKPELVVVWGMWNLSKKMTSIAEQKLPGKVAYYFASYWPMDPNIHKSYWDATANHRLTEKIKKPLREIAYHQIKKECSVKLEFKHSKCCSKFVRDILIDSDSIPPNAGVLFSGIDTLPFYRKINDKPSGELIRLVYFGSLIHQKGVHIAIEALGQLKTSGFFDRFDLTLIGGGHPEYINSLKTLSEHLGVSEKVHFLGKVARDEIPNLLNQNDVFLFTSIWAEPMARTVMEAMAAGLLVIGSEVGGQTEILRDGENALTYQPGDACELASKIRFALNNPDLMKEIARAGQDTVLNHFTLDRMVNEFETWLRSIVQ